MPEELRLRIKKVKEQYKYVSDPGFIDLFERRDIVFIADGTDVNAFKKFKDKRLSVASALNKAINKQ